MRHTQPRAGWRRGSLAIGVLIAMALLSLVALGVVTSSGLRAFGVADARSGARAQLAAESAIQMGLRELSLNADSDGDGTIGAIGTGTPLTIDGASVRVAKTISSPNTLLTATATLGAVQRKTRATLLGVTGNERVEMFYLTAGTAYPRVIQYSGGSIVTGASPAADTADIYWVVGKSCPFRDELTLATLDPNFDVEVSVRAGTTWGSMTRVCSDAATADSRAFDVAYEQSSGDGLVCYWNNTLNEVGYRTVTNGVVSSEGTLALPTSADVRWVSLVPRPGSDEILLLTLDSSNDLVATIWNGASFGASSVLEANTSTTTTACFAGSYQTTSGVPVVVWGRSGSNQPRYSRWNGSTWTSSLPLSSVSAPPAWIRMSSDPLSNKLLLGICSTLPQVWLSSWDGTTWALPFSVGAITAYDGNTVDVAFEATTGKGLALYRKNNGTNELTLYYRTWSGSAWGAETSAFSVADNPDWVELVPRPGTAEMYIAVKSTAARLDSAYWSGSWMSPAYGVSTTLTGLDMHCAFDLNISGTADYTVVSMQQIP